MNTLVVTIRLQLVIKRPSLLMFPLSLKNWIFDVPVFFDSSFSFIASIGSVLGVCFAHFNPKLYEVVVVVKEIRPESVGLFVQICNY